MSKILITIGGKERPWIGNQMTIEYFARKISIDTWTTSSSYAATFAGLMAGCYVNDEEPDFTFTDVCKWVDEIYDSNVLTVIEQVKEAFESCNAYTKWLEKFMEKLRVSAPENADKKKVETT